MPPSKDETTSAADYLTTMSGDLAAIARRHGFHTLGYILDMARLEAEALSHARKPPAAN